MPKDNCLDIEEIIKEFKKSERSSTHRKGSLKIEIPFEQAVKKIAKAKPEVKKSKKRVRKNDDQ